MSTLAIDTFGPEILQKSDLGSIEIPDNCPSSVYQQTVTVNNEHFDLIEEALIQTANCQSVAAKYSKLPQADAVLHYLTDAKFNFNGVNAVRGESIWKQRVELAISEQRPVHINYPLMCKIGNRLKVMDAKGPTFGEITTLIWFGQIAQGAETLYTKGIHINIICDATFYNTAFGNCPVEAQHYVDQLRTIVKERQLSRWITIHDFTSLAGEDTPSFCEAFDKHFDALMTSIHQIIGEEKYLSLLNSTRACINTRHLGMSYNDMVEVFTSRKNTSNRYYQWVTEQAKQALCTQMAVKLSADELNVIENRLPNGIRATCHKGKKKSVSVLGLRTHPSYYKQDKRLPYHGIPLLRFDKKPYISIWPEIILRADSSLLRVENKNAAALLYIKN